MNNIFKRMLSLMLVLAMCISLAPASALAVETEDDSEPIETVEQLPEEQNAEQNEAAEPATEEEKEPVFIPVESITITAEKTELEVGDTMQLTATVLPEDATNKEVTWESSDETVVGVDENGFITSLDVGTAIISVYAQDGIDVSGSIEIIVLDDFLTNNVFLSAAAEKITYSMVFDRVMEYYNTVTVDGTQNAYWNANLSSTQTKTCVDNDNYIGTITRSSGSSKSNLFKGVGCVDSSASSDYKKCPYSPTSADATCSGFAAFMEYIIFNTQSDLNFSVLKKAPDTIKPGDQVRYNGHSYVIYKVSGDTASIIECNNPSGSCKVNLGEKSISTIKGYTFDGSTSFYISAPSVSNTDWQSKIDLFVETAMGQVGNNTNDWCGGLCAKFVCKCAETAGIESNYIKYDSTGASPYVGGKQFGFINSDGSLNYNCAAYTWKDFKEGRYSPQKGDLVFYGDMNGENCGTADYTIQQVAQKGNYTHQHVGIIRDNSSTISELYTVEGNVTGDITDLRTRKMDENTGSVTSWSKDVFVMEFIRMNATDSQSSGTYLSRCESRPCSAEITVKKATYPKTLPCSSETDSSSVVVGSGAVSEGNKYTATAILENTVGNYWYKTQISGQTAYIYGGDVTTSLKTPTITVSSERSPSGTWSKASSFDIKGIITSNVYISSVTGEISGTGGSSKTISDVNDYSFNIYDKLNSSLKFGSLGTGSHEYSVKTTTVQYYTNNGTSLSTSNYTKKVISSTFVIGEPVIIQYTVKYDANNGSGAPDEQKKKAGEPLTLSSSIPTRAGYSFQGWATSSSATTAKYKPGDSYTSDAAVTLYAVWKANTYSFSFNANGGTGSMTTQTISFGQNFTISSNSFVYKGHSFQGWHVYRVADKKWYVPEKGWKTDGEISQYDYTMKLYPNEASHTLDESWIKDCSSISNYIFYAVWKSTGGTSYISQCTKYPCSATITVKNKTYPKALPCSNATEPSDVVGSGAVTVGNRYTATALWLNTAGRYWYQTTVSGQTAYIYGGDVTTSLSEPKITVDNERYPSGTWSKASAFDIKGDISSSLPILSVTASVSGSGGSSKTASNVNSYTFSIYNKLNNDIKFGSLGSGEHVYTVDVTVARYYTDTGETLKTSNYSKQVRKSTFTIGNVNTNTYTIGFDSNGGSGSMNSFTVDYNQEFTIPSNQFYRNGYDFQGWNLYRVADGKWYVPGEGWNTSSEISSKGFTKKLYSDCHGLRLDDSWTKQYSGVSSYVFYAVWTEYVPGVSIVSSGTCGANLTWTLDANGLLAINGTGAMTDFTVDSSTLKCSAPWYTVDETTKVLETIKSVSISNGVTSIGDSAFFNCRAISSISLPQSITSIGNLAFFGCVKLTDIIIPDNVSNIGISAFYCCSNLSSINIPGKITKIEDYTFEWCSSLTTICIPNSVTSIGTYTFYGCSSLESITIPNSVTSIGSYAFFGCSSLTNIVIPDGVVTIGTCAFISCSGLTRIEIPASVSSIGNSSFIGCECLTEFIVSPSNTYYSSHDGILFNKEMTSLISCPAQSFSTYVIPDSVTQIEDSAFRNCTSLTNITIPASVTSIGTYAFYGCSSLTSVIISASVTSIGANVFNGCSSLTSVTIPDSVTYIGYYAFASCTSLTSITIPESVTYIEGNSMFAWGAFYNCEYLKTIVFKHSADDVLTIGDGAFYRSSDEILQTTVNVPNVDNINPAISGYKWADSCRQVSFEPLQISGTCGDNLTWTLDVDGNLSIRGTGAMYNYSSSNSSSDTTAPWGNYYAPVRIVEIDSGVTSIGTYTFYGCSSLESITIPNSVRSIGEDAFEGCSLLTSIIIPNSVTSIGAYTFYGCRSLTSIIIPNSVTSIGDRTFNGCRSLTSITIPNSVRSIGEYAFEGCSLLTSIIIPNRVTSIGEGAFGGCSSLSSITVSSENTVYSSSDGVLFDRAKTKLMCCPAGKSGAYIVPNSVTSIGNYSFSDCSLLTSITIPNSVTSIGTYTFDGCSSLKDIYYAGNEAQWNSITIASGNECLTDATIHYNSIIVTFGDVNLDGEVNILDVSLLRRAAAGLVELTDDQKAVSDIYSDGKYNSLDVNLLRRYVAGLVTQIPIDKNQ